MSVEIREIVIRAITSPDERENTNQAEIGHWAVDREAIVQECVRQVMYLLRKKEER